MRYDYTKDEKWNSAYFEALKGKTITEIKGSIGDEVINILCSDGTQYRMIYWDDCCASATLEDIIGDINDIIGSPIVMAEEVSNSEENPDGTKADDYDSFTWTFYKLATTKGYVTLRWYGSSNGYYSESPSFEVRQ